ncbi:ABC transporter ATP-binding protein [Petroclostridium sp. X23]|uniref:energy-coupling factor ABC transporter ATP-binding protein n=1 Tax=Petroclostridium sp. X23 TaxID=3045146 RepID=UPI0024AD00A1|nr:ABC transporter ATP-binding protein [Petroclostridium sp. X23]WHH56881.1 ABC transporter ATP-binding protein [Petroclostridium sp. X23]
MQQTDITIFGLNNVSYSYIHNQPVLENINLKISKGEKVCILGANGCGKSTLLKILCGLISPNSGEFTAFEERITEEKLENDHFSKQYHQKVGFIFQDSDVQLFCSSVWDEIAFGPLQMGYSEQETMDRVEDVIRMLRLETLRERPPYRLSGGEKKKVAIAAILATNPEVLILDEPTNGLDPKSQRWLVSLLVQLNKAGKTIITSTHNLELVQEISDRAVVFNENYHIAEDGATHKILTNKELLIKVNLVDEYYHTHGGVHSHYHIHNY